MIHLEHDTFGDPNDPPLLLVMGLGFQLIHWDPEFCRRLADQGFYVIRFDNRDVGLSTKIRGGPKPNPLAAFAGITKSASYTLWDMADDTAGLLDRLRAARRPRGRHLDGGHDRPVAGHQAPRPRALARPRCSPPPATGASASRACAPWRCCSSERPKEREAYLDFAVEVGKVIGSRKYMDESRVRNVAAAAYDRCYYPVGMLRQLVGIQASGDRTEQLKRLDVPTVVIHGSDDPLVPTRAGHATAKAIPGARMVEIADLAHDLPPAVWDQVVEAIVENTQRAPATATRQAA